MKKPLLLLLLSAAISGAALAQDIPPDKAARSTAIMNDIRKMELLGQIVPLTLSKDQVKALLPAIEKVRDKLRRIYLQEADELLRYEKSSQRAVTEALKEPAKMPDSQLVREVIAYKRAAEIRRMVAMNEGIDEEIVPAINKTLNKGQIAVMAKSLSLQFFEPGLPPNQVNDAVRLRVFAREILLDPITYELFRQMIKP